MDVSLYVLCRRSTFLGQHNCYVTLLCHTRRSSQKRDGDSRVRYSGTHIVYGTGYRNKRKMSSNPITRVPSIGEAGPSNYQSQHQGSVHDHASDWSTALQSQSKLSIDDSLDEAFDEQKYLEDVFAAEFEDVELMEADEVDEDEDLDITEDLMRSRQNSFDEVIDMFRDLEGQTSMVTEDATASSDEHYADWSIDIDTATATAQQLAIQTQASVQAFIGRLWPDPPPSEETVEEIELGLYPNAVDSIGESTLTAGEAKTLRGISQMSSTAARAWKVGAEVSRPRKSLWRWIAGTGLPSKREEVV